MTTFAPHLDILPPAQRRLWEEFADAVPRSFVLYDGTALALRTGSRQSEDFDFFTNDPIDPHVLARHLPFLAGARLVQAAPSTGTFIVDRQGPVKLSIFGGLRLGSVREPSLAVPGHVTVASLLDLAAQKVRVVQVRAERKDYLDIATLFAQGVTLSSALGAAQALYPELDVLVSMKALSFFGDGDLPSLPGAFKQAILEAVKQVRDVDPVDVLAARVD